MTVVIASRVHVRRAVLNVYDGHHTVAPGGVERAIYCAKWSFIAQDRAIPRAGMPLRARPACGNQAHAPEYVCGHTVFCYQTGMVWPHEPSTARGNRCRFRPTTASVCVRRSSRVPADCSIAVDSTPCRSTT